jgi:hypothetical protein
MVPQGARVTGALTAINKNPALLYADRASAPSSRGSDAR